MLLGLQHLTAILGALRSILGKAREFFVSMAVTDYAVLAMFAILFAKASYALVLAIFKLLVWIARCIIGFLFDLPHLVPLLFTAALPIFRLPLYQKLPDGLEDMLRKRPCTPYGTGDFLIHLIDNGYDTAPLKFCLWYLDFISRTNDNYYKFSIWGTAEQDRVEAIFLPGSLGGRAKIAVLAARLMFLPWEMFDQPPVSVLSVAAQAQAAALTTHLFDTYGLVNPFYLGCSDPYAKEFQMVLAIFCASGAPMKLALPTGKVSGLLAALQLTSHHSAFKAIYDECRPVVDVMVKEFYRQHNSIVSKGGIGSATHMALFSILCIVIVFSVTVIMKTSLYALAIPGLMLFIFFLLLLGNLNKLYCTGRGFLHRSIRPSEVFLMDRDYLKMCKKPSLLLGTARKQSLESDHWSPKYTTRLFLWNNLCLSISEALENTFGELFTLLFNDRVVTAFHERIHKMFQKEVWVVEPCIRQLHGVLFYSIVFLSVLGTGCGVGLYAFFIWRRVHS